MEKSSAGVRSAGRRLTVPFLKSVLAGLLIGWLIWRTVKELPEALQPSRILRKERLPACYPPLPYYATGITGGDLQKALGLGSDEAQGTQRRGRPHSNLSSTIEAGIADKSLTSASIVVFTAPSDGDDGIVLERGFGVKRGNETTQASDVTADTVYRLASVSKVFTAFELLLQEKADKVDLDADISRYLPDYELNTESWSHRLGWSDAPPSRASSAKVTARQLLTHFGGLGRDVPVKGPPLWIGDLPDAPENGDTNATAHNPTREDVMRGVRTVPYVTSTWTDPVYSNVGFNLAGFVATDAEKLATGEETSYRALMQRDVFRPLGMDSSFYLADTPLQISKLAVPAAPFSGEADNDMDAEDSAGGMFSSANDLRRFLQSLLAPGADALLSADEVRRWLQPTHVFSDGFQALGMPWEMTSVEQPPASRREHWARAPNRRKTMLFTKGGNLGGYHTLIALEPRRRLGAVLLTTAPTQVHVSAMLLDALLPVMRAFDAEQRARSIKAFAGRYRNSSAGASARDEARISYESEALWLDALVVRGRDVLAAVQVQDPVPRAGHRPARRVALWPTDEPGIFRIAIGRGPPRPGDGCEPLWASIDPPLPNRFPADLVAIRAGRFHFPAANFTAARV